MSALKRTRDIFVDLFGFNHLLFNITEHVVSLILIQHLIYVGNIMGKIPLIVAPNADNETTSILIIYKSIKKLALCLLTLTYKDRQDKGESLSIMHYNCTCLRWDRNKMLLHHPRFCPTHLKEFQPLRISVQRKWYEKISIMPKGGQRGRGVIFDLPMVVFQYAKTCYFVAKDPVPLQ